jgi:DNA-binding transcriptional LysR family regulator
MMPVDHPAVRDEILCEVEAVCVLPNEHRLCGKAEIEPHDLAGENFISFLRDGRLRHVIDSVFEQARVSRELRIDAFMSDSACAFVAAGVGVSIVEPFTAGEYANRGELVVKPFRPSVVYQFRLLFPRFREPSLLAQAFVEELRASIYTRLLTAATPGTGAGTDAGADTGNGSPTRKLSASSPLQRKARAPRVVRGAVRE